MDIDSSVSLEHILVGKALPKHVDSLSAVLSTTKEWLFSGHRTDWV